jgi:hypothetical protein
MLTDYNLKKEKPQILTLLFFSSLWGGKRASSEFPLQSDILKESQRISLFFALLVNVENKGNNTCLLCLLLHSGT